MVDIRNSRIAKNSLMLYTRMLFMTLVIFYTSRVMLKAMGVVDFGIYNIVGGIVVLFSFLNNTMTSSIQRFLNYLLGKNDLEKLEGVFVQGVVVSYIFAFIFFLLCETVGLYYVKEYLNVPVERERASFFAYQMSILGSLFMILRIPYVACVISYERMDAYAVISIMDTVLKLAIVWTLYIIPYDRLITYSVLLVLVNFFTTILYVFYSKKKFSIITHKLYVNYGLLRRLLSFTGWNLLGSSSSVISTQGMAIFINLFFGVVANAAMGIANQVLSGIYNIAASFTNAFNPILVKSYAEGDVPYYTNLLSKSSRLTFCLMWVVCLPVFVWCKELLGLWLGTIPRFSVEFCRIMVLYSLIEGVSTPLWMIAHAEGNIKNYQVTISFLTIFSLLLGYALLSVSNSPSMFLLARLLVSLITYIYRVFYVRTKFSYSLVAYSKDFLFIAFKIVIISSPLLFLLYLVKIPLVLSLVLGIIVSVIVVLLMGLTTGEQSYVTKMLKLNAIFRFFSI